MELKNQCIFILGLMRHDDVIESTNYTIARHLAKNNQVFYIDNPYTYKDYVQLRNTPAFKRRKPHFSPESNGIIDTAIPSLKIIITLPVISINWLPEGDLYRAAQRVNEKMIFQRVLQVKKQFGIRKFIYINSFNFYYPNLGGMLAPSLAVYHCVDPLIHPYELKHGSVSEAQIAQQSDLVICTSNYLVRKWSALNPNTFFIPNAADTAHSGKALLEYMDTHRALAAIPGPIIGYFGAVERRLDYELLQTVAIEHPDKSFVFAGPVSPEHLPDWFAELPNVFLTGPVPYEEMPQVLKSFSIAIIPFKKDEVSAGIFPLKLFEYLGAGLPVVSTDFNPDLAGFTKDTVHYCQDAVSFSGALNSAISEKDDPALKTKRLAVAAENTWEQRAETFASLIYDQLQLKQQALHQL